LGWPSVPQSVIEQLLGLREAEDDDGELFASDAASDREDGDDSFGDDDDDGANASQGLADTSEEHEGSFTDDQSLEGGHSAYADEVVGETEQQLHIRTLLNVTILLFLLSLIRLQC
jgi:hypothetical protein